MYNICLTIAVYFIDNEIANHTLTCSITVFSFHLTKDSVCAKLMNAVMAWYFAIYINYASALKILETIMWSLQKIKEAISEGKNKV